MTITIGGLHHAQIATNKGTKKDGRQFYCGVLGLPELAKPLTLTDHGGFWLQVGTLQLHAGTETAVERAATEAQLTYAVASVKAWRERLAAAGSAPLDGGPLLRDDRFECRDPFGNRLESIAPRADSARSHRAEYAFSL